MLIRNWKAGCTGVLPSASLMHWVVSSLIHDVPGRGWYHDSCTALLNGAISASGLNVEAAASIVSFGARSAAAWVAVVVFLLMTRAWSIGRGAAALLLAGLFSAGAPLHDRFLLPSAGLSESQTIFYEIARVLLGGIFLMWIMAPREAAAEVLEPAVEPERELYTTAYTTAVASAVK